MTKEQALIAIKTLRNQINDTPDPTGWVNAVLDHLDRAADVIEFPEVPWEDQ